MSEDQPPRLDYATPGMRSRGETMTAVISLIGYGGMALAIVVWLVWIEEWQVRRVYRIPVLLFMPFAIWGVYRSVRALLRRTNE